VQRHITADPSDVPRNVLRAGGASRLVGTATREHLPALGNTRARARERVLIVDHGAWATGRGEAIILSLVGNAAIRFSPETRREESESEREGEQDVITDRLGAPSSAWQKRPFILFVRLSVYPSGSFISKENARVSADTIFHRSPPRAPCVPLPPAPEASSQRRSAFLSRLLALTRLRPARLSSLNAIGIYPLFGKPHRRHLASCHVYRATPRLSAFLVGIQLPLVDRYGVKDAGGNSRSFLGSLSIRGISMRDLGSPPLIVARFSPHDDVVIERALLPRLPPLRQLLEHARGWERAEERAHPLRTNPLDPFSAVPTVSSYKLETDGQGMK